MGQHFWHPVQSLVDEGGGWRLLSLDDKTLGVVLPSGDGRYEVWLRRGTLAQHVATARTLPAAAQRLWNAAHPEARF